MVESILSMCEPIGSISRTPPKTDRQVDRQRRLEEERGREEERRELGRGREREKRKFTVCLPPDATNCAIRSIQQHRARHI